MEQATNSRSEIAGRWVPGTSPRTPEVKMPALLPLSMLLNGPPTTPHDWLLGLLTYGPRRTGKLLGVVVVAAAIILLSSRNGNAQTDGIGQIALPAVDSWGYQLQHVVPHIIAPDGFDILVVDYSRDGSDAKALTKEEVSALRRRPGQPDRIVLAYLSIGEAEDYRFYWQGGWTTDAALPQIQARLPKGFKGAADGNGVGVPIKDAPLAVLSADAPSWLAGENAKWRGNYLVRYWDASWQSIIFGSPESYLDKILAAGFDGVYLDKIDSNDDWQKTRPSAERDMVDFVKRLSAYARSKQPDFFIVPQNAEELLQFQDYLAIINAIAKEDLIFGGGQRKDGERNPEAEILASKGHLDMALKAGKIVLAVEYVEQPEAVEYAYERLISHSYIPFFAKRALDAPPAVALPAPDTQKR